MTVKIYAPEGSGPCAKQTTIATVVTFGGDRFISTNHCMKPQTACPRAGMPTGVGYELCKSVCEQEAHAEVNAIRLAGEKASGALLYLDGHTYVCASCLEAAKAAGIVAQFIVTPLEIK